MKFNKWTVGLAAVGAVSLASVAQAEEKASSVMTAVSSTTLSGYVDTSMNWNIGDGNGRVANYAFNTSGKQDGFNLNAVDIKLSKALDESEWAAGYMIDIFQGPDGGYTGTIFKQAYVNVRTPVGNGIDWKVGLFDNIIGYESTESPSDPNFSRSYGYTLEPRDLTGILANYKFTELISASVAVADSLNFAANNRANPPFAESSKAYAGSVALTAPNDWSFISGSSFYLGIENGDFNEADPAVAGGAVNGAATFFYAGATINTPITGLRTGLSFDHAKYRPVSVPGGGPAGFSVTANWADSIAAYASYQATEKLSFHGRAEYFVQKSDVGPIVGPNEVMAYTATVQYDLWKNVLSRVELRWDHQLGNILTDSAAGTAGGWYGTPIPNAGTVATPGATAGRHNSYTVVANIAYKF